MPAKKATACNVSANLYDNDFVVYFDCVGEHMCKMATFYVDPPDPTDECEKKVGGQCTDPLACRNALSSLRDRITEELKRYELGRDIE